MAGHRLGALVCVKRASMYTVTVRDMLCDHAPDVVHPDQAFFVIRGGEGGGVKSWRRQALFQGRHCFCPTPTLSKKAGRHPPPGGGCARH